MCVCLYAVGDLQFFIFLFFHIIDSILPTNVFVLSAFPWLQLELANYLYDSLLTIPNIHVYGPAPSETNQRGALCSFNVEKLHATDIATILDEMVWSASVKFMIVCDRLSLVGFKIHCLPSTSWRKKMWNYCYAYIFCSNFFHPS